ncbi:hypothetical protein [Pararhodospirillum oryzae]|uniref:Uncharacterized protein n=1 Tax=Pararhodospirillum oryzae TaxID=478448 RepID=A0A512HB39_9PROT|nr:hypothetical protein [Pararhodospirillum oryzae]GEO82600.1 hypothetical protein ROR02_27310 [Pararhodospirillum oryzae]
MSMTETGRGSGTAPLPVAVCVRLTEAPDDRGRVALADVRLPGLGIEVRDISISMAGGRAYADLPKKRGPDGRRRAVLTLPPDLTEAVKLAALRCWARSGEAGR